MKRDGRIWILSEAYHPDEDGTAYYMTRLAEDLAARRRVGVICGPPRSAARRAAVPADETRRGVAIHRCPVPALDKNRLASRALLAVASSLAIFAAAARRLRRGDVVLVVTNPPVLPFLALLAARLRGARCILRVEDVYPEALTAAGLLARGGLGARLLESLHGLLYRGVDRIVVLGRDMERLVRARAGRSAAKVRLIPNWADVDAVAPAPKSASRLLNRLGLGDRGVVLCAGNMGRVQEIETVFGAAERLRDRDGIRFLFIGRGAKGPWMKREKAAKGLRNVELLDALPRREQQDFLCACDLVVVPLVAGLAGAGVPSRMYNAMAAGKPLLALGDPDSETARVVEEEGIGWRSSPGDPDHLAATIEAALSDRGRLASMGRRARRAAETRYAADVILGRYRALIESVS